VTGGAKWIPRVYEQYAIVLPKYNGLRLFQDHPNAGRYLEKFLYLYLSIGYPVKAGNTNTLQWSPFNIYYEAEGLINMMLN